MNSFLQSLAQSEKKICEVETIIKCLGTTLQVATRLPRLKHVS